MAWCRDLLDYCEIAWFVYTFNLVIHIYWARLIDEEGRNVLSIAGSGQRYSWNIWKITLRNFEILPCECCVSRHGNRKIWIRILSCNRSSQSQTGHIRLKFLTVVWSCSTNLLILGTNLDKNFQSPTPAKIAQHCPIKCCNNANNDAVKYHNVHYLIIYSTT